MAMPLVDTTQDEWTTKNQSNKNVALSDPLATRMRPHASFVFSLGLELVAERCLRLDDNVPVRQPQQAHHSTTQTISRSPVHSLTDSLALRHKCDLCAFRSESSIVIDSHHAEPHRTTSLRCYFCRTFRTVSQPAYRHHMLVEHGRTCKIERPLRVENQCATCTFESAPTTKTKTLAEHLASTCPFRSFLGSGGGGGGGGDEQSFSAHDHTYAGTGGGSLYIPIDYRSALANLQAPTQLDTLHYEFMFGARPLHLCTNDYDVISSIEYSRDKWLMRDLVDAQKPTLLSTPKTSTKTPRTMSIHVPAPKNNNNSSNKKDSKTQKICNVIATTSGASVVTATATPKIDINPIRPDKNEECKAKKNALAHAITASSASAFSSSTSQSTLQQQGSATLTDASCVPGGVRDVDAAAAAAAAVEREKRLVIHTLLSHFYTNYTNSVKQPSTSTPTPLATTSRLRKFDFDSIDERKIIRVVALADQCFICNDVSNNHIVRSPNTLLASGDLLAHLRDVHKWHAHAHTCLFCGMRFDDDVLIVDADDGDDDANMSELNIEYAASGDTIYTNLLVHQYTRHNAFYMASADRLYSFQQAQAAPPPLISANSAVTLMSTQSSLAVLPIDSTLVVVGTAASLGCRLDEPIQLATIDEAPILADTPVSAKEHEHEQEQEEKENHQTTATITPTTTTTTTTTTVARQFESLTCRVCDICGIRLSGNAAYSTHVADAHLKAVQIRVERVQMPLRAVNRESRTSLERAIGEPIDSGVMKKMGRPRGRPPKRLSHANR